MIRPEVPSATPLNYRDILSAMPSNKQTGSERTGIFLKCKNAIIMIGPEVPSATPSNKYTGSTTPSNK